MTTNDCEAWSELLALRLYDELEGDEGARLAAHLEGCAACRALAGELERGLGRLRDPAPAATAPRARPWLVPALAFAAGVLVALGWSALARDAAPVAPVEHDAASSAFARSTPPPPARDRGFGAVLAALPRADQEPR